MSEAESFIKLEKGADGVAVLTLNRPEKLNAIRLDMIKPWVDALMDVADDPEVKVMILTGAGRAFCAGGDFGGIRERQEQTDAMLQKDFLWRHLHRIPLLMEQMDKPVIAAVNGPARGAGVDITLMCDIKVAAQSASFAMSYINVGLTPSDGGAYYLPRAIGVDRALEMIWSGRAVGSEEAKEIGLVTYVVPDDQLMKKAHELATTFARQSQDAIRCSKRAVYQSLNMTLAAHLDMISSHSTVLRGTKEHERRLNAATKGKR